MGLQGQISKEIEKAKESGKYLIMLSYIDKDTELLHHRTFTSEFLIGDFDRVILEHTKHLNEERSKTGRSRARGAQGSEENPKDTPA
jgi:hypothetical protein